MGGENEKDSQAHAAAAVAAEWSLFVNKTLFTLEMNRNTMNFNSIEAIWLKWDPDMHSLFWQDAKNKKMFGDLQEHAHGLKHFNQVFPPFVVCKTVLRQTVN